MEAAKDHDVGMVDRDGGTWTSEADEHAEWLRWKAMEERKRTLYVVFILSSLLVSAYNHTPALTNSEIQLDLPCDEEFFSAESSVSFHAKGGVAAANHNRLSFRESLGRLLRLNVGQNPVAFANGHQGVGSMGGHEDFSKSDLRPSTFGCLILINALHNYIWETRQRHHNKIWTNEETEKMHRHIEPALRAWQTAWASTLITARSGPTRSGKVRSPPMPSRCWTWPMFVFLSIYPARRRSSGSVTGMVLRRSSPAARRLFSTPNNRRLRTRNPPAPTPRTALGTAPSLSTRPQPNPRLPTLTLRNSLPRVLSTPRLPSSNSSPGSRTRRARACLLPAGEASSEGSILRRRFALHV